MTKKILLLPVLVLFLFWFYCSADCTALQDKVDIEQMWYEVCNRLCLDDVMNLIRPVNTNCDVDVCSADKSNLESAQAALAACQLDPCPWGSMINWECIVNNAWNMWINMNQTCLINWQCKFDIYQTLWIRQSMPAETRSSPWIFIQDIILSATFFVGTLITWVLIISWLLFVFAWINGNLAAKAKKWITWSLIWLLFVVWSYAFVRLIQFLITWWGW